jgi:hypothetical protein
MSRDTCFNQPYKCVRCGKETKRVVWLSEINDQLCKESDCGGGLEPIIEEEIEESFSVGGKYKKGRPKKEANKRRTDHFRKEILPTLSGWERKHFEKTKGKPL